MLGGVIWEFLRQTVAGGRKTARLGLALVLGGGAGNYAERRRKGFVTDYVSLGVGNSKIRKWVFNFSDVCIVLGGLSWAGASLLPKRKNKGSLHRRRAMKIRMYNVGHGDCFCLRDRKKGACWWILAPATAALTAETVRRFLTLLFRI